jgi:hypothetical protein
MCDDTDNPFLTIKETAQLLRVKPRTLDNLRWRKEGPPWHRHGGRIVYHRHEVMTWSEQRSDRTTPPDRKKVPAPNAHPRAWPAPANPARAACSRSSLEFKP